MTTRGLKQVIDYLQQSLPPDAQLLPRFVAARDEDAFAALVRRHGPMVLGVCRRVLGHVQDAEDAFQATFLVLARLASSVMKRESVGSWLHQVAYRTALRSHAANLRRRGREKQVEDMPHPATGPVEPQDWRPLLDRELIGLPPKYREAVVLCDLEGKTRKEAARQLGVPEGTLSGRLTAARRLLAQRLSRYGLTLSGGALATALSAEASAAVPSALVLATVKAGLLVAAGQLAAVSTPAALLMKGVMKAMFLQKLKVIVAAVLMTAALGVGGLAYQAAEPKGAAQEPPKANRPPSELEALRKENELLRLNLLILLEKIHAREAEVATLKGKKTGAGDPMTGMRLELRTTESNRDMDLNPDATVRPPRPNPGNHPYDNQPNKAPTAPRPQHSLPEAVPGTDPRPFPQAKNLTTPPDPVQEAEAALKALREARDPEARQRAEEALEKAVKKLRGQKGSDKPKRN